MKVQDILFFIIVLSLFVSKRNFKWFLFAGIICFLVAIPLFELWVFFTAQRLVWYGVGFFFIAILLSVKNIVKLKK